MSYEQASSPEGSQHPEADEHSTAGNEDPGKSRLPEALRRQFYRAFTPGVLTIIAAIDEILSEHNRPEL
jgi:hypothetical protein